MFKVTVSDVESFGREYFTTTRVAFGKSPKQAWASSTVTTVSIPFPVVIPKGMVSNTCTQCVVWKIRQNNLRNLGLISRWGLTSPIIVV